MSYGFGVGNGRLTKKQIRLRKRIATKHGCTFHVVAGNQGQCVCGRGCQIDSCPIKHYWFLAPNYGESFNATLRRAVESEVEQEDNK